MFTDDGELNDGLRKKPKHNSTPKTLCGQENYTLSASQNNYLNHISNSFFSRNVQKTLWKSRTI